MKFLVAVLAALFGTTSALAADLPARTYTKAPAYVDPGYDWTGFYAGLNGGYSWGTSSNSFAAPLAAFSTPQRMDGWVFGGQLGYNWEFNRSWVLGLEGDIDATGQRGTATLGPVTAVTVFVPPPGARALPTVTTTVNSAATFEERLSWLSTVRGRLGFLPSDRVLLYATGGLAVGEIRTNATATTTTTTALSFGVPPGPTAAAFAGSSTSDRVGWTVGAGIEGALGNNWSARLEYLYVDLGTINDTFAGLGGIAPITVSSHVTDNIVRAGVNYKFSGPLLAVH